MTNATIIVDPNGGLRQTRLLLWILKKVVYGQYDVTVDPVNCTGVSKHISDTMYAPPPHSHQVQMVQPSDRQPYTSTDSTKYGVCVFGAASLLTLTGAASLLTLTATKQHRAIYFFYLFTKPVHRPVYYTPRHKMNKY